MKTKHTLASRLVEIRRCRGLSQRKVAAALGVAPSYLCKVETGMIKPSVEFVARMADVLGVPLSIGDEAVPTSVGFLGVESLCCLQANDSISELSKDAIARLLKTECEIRALEESMGVVHETSVLLVQPSVLGEQGAELAARLVRESLGVGTAPIADIASLLDFHRVRLHALDLPGNRRSLSYYNGCDASYGIVVCSTNTPERQTWQIAYELGVATLFASGGRIPLRDRKPVKVFAKRFAGQFLMPEEEVRACVAQCGIAPDRWSMAALLALKARFGVSAETFALRLLELGLLGEPLHTTLRDELRRGYEDHPKAKEPAPRHRPLEFSLRLAVMRAAKRKEAAS